MAPGGESHGLFWSFDVPTAAAIQIRWAITTVWHDKHGRFSIGAQFGGPNVGHIPRLKKELRELLNESCDSTGSDTIDHIALVLRINGPITDFGAEGAIASDTRQSSAWWAPTSSFHRTL